MAKLTFILFLWLLPITAQAAAVPQAQALWDQGDYRQAFAAAFEPATHGDAHAQFLIGEAYRLGRSVDPDMVQARDWYSRAAQQGDVDAAAALGELLVKSRQAHDAIPWLTLAASHNHAHATALLAAIFYTGDGTDRNLMLATSLMKKAAAEGSPEAKARLAFMDDTAEPVDVSTSPEPVEIAGKVAPPAPTETAVAAEPIRSARMVRIERTVQPVAHAHETYEGMKLVHLQVGAFRSVRNAQRACTYLAARVPDASSDLRIIRRHGFYEVRLLVRGSLSARLMHVRLTALRWQHFVRVGQLSRA